jgi:catechol 2,3-dioxygenase-like lactoylglutathione lyase family enzyme
MSIRFDHTIVHSKNPEESARFLAEILGLPGPSSFGPFLVVELANAASLDFLDAGGMDIQTQHYAFRIDEDDFDRTFARVRERGLRFWADPHKSRPARSTATRAAAASTSTTRAAT